MPKRDIKEFTLREVEKTVVELGEPAYRAGQIFHWLYRRGVGGFGEMDNVPKALRNKLMPVNKRYPLGRLIKACEDFRDKTGRMVTLEYLLMKGMNDSARDAAELAASAKRLRAKVNLIPYSAIPGLSYRTPQTKDIKVFMKRLIQNGINVTLRESKGEDIQAACGQLAGREKNET